MGDCFVTKSDENSVWYVGETKLEVTKGNRSQLVGGNAQEYVNGDKTFHIFGSLTELHFALKTEVITGHESHVMGGLLLGVTVAMKRELDISFRTEIGHAWSYHVLVPGAKRVIGSSKVEALQDERLVSDYKQAMGKKYIKALKRLEKFGQLKEKITQAKLKAAELEQNANDMRQSIRKINMKCSSFKNNVTGELKFDVGEFVVTCDGEMEVEGSSVKLEGGGATFEVGGMIAANGTSLTC